MNRIRSSIAVFIGITALVSGCATNSPIIDDDQLNAYTDDGTDFYATDLGGGQSLNVNQGGGYKYNDQGQPVYGLNSVQQGSFTAYYIGDTRYRLAGNTSFADTRFPHGDYQTGITDHRPHSLRRGVHVPRVNTNQSDANQANSSSNSNSQSRQRNVTPPPRNRSAPRNNRSTERPSNDRRTSNEPSTRSR